MLISNAHAVAPQSIGVLGEAGEGFVLSTCPCDGCAASTPSPHTFALAMLPCGGPMLAGVAGELRCYPWGLTRPGRGAAPRWRYLCRDGKNLRCLELI